MELGGLGYLTNIHELYLYYTILYYTILYYILCYILIFDGYKWIQMDT